MIGVDWVVQRKIREALIATFSIITKIFCVLIPPSNKTSHNSYCRSIDPFFSFLHINMFSKTVLSIALLALLLVQESSGAIPASVKGTRAARIARRGARILKDKEKTTTKDPKEATKAPTIGTKVPKATKVPTGTKAPTKSSTSPAMSPAIVDDVAISSNNTLEDDALNITDTNAIDTNMTDTNSTNSTTVESDEVAAASSASACAYGIMASVVYGTIMSVVMW